MMVGVCRVALRLPENQSLKGKRQVIRSLIARVQQQFGAAIAEVEAQDRWQVAVLGAAYVSASAQHARQVIEHVVEYIEASRLDAEVTEVEIDVLSM